MILSPNHPRVARPSGLDTAMLHFIAQSSRRSLACAQLSLAALLGFSCATSTAQTLTQIPIITTYAGTGSLTTTSGGDGGLATAAGLNNPEGIAYDGKGNTYISDYGNQTIRVINSSGVITTVFGTTGTVCPNPTASSGACGDGGAASAATFKNPTALQFDTSGNLYIADYNDQRIRKITATNGVISGSSIISTVAGNGTAGFTGTGGAATSAELDEPHGLAVDSAGDLFISNQGNNSGCTIEYVPAANQTLIIGGTSTSLTAGHIYVIAGQTGTCGYISDSNGTTQATASQLNAPTNIALDSTGANLYIADLDNGRIRKVAVSSGVITTVAGNGTTCTTYAPNASPSSVPSCGDGGAATSANLAGPAGVFIDAAGNIIIGDSVGARVRKVNTSGTISTIGGTSQQCTNGATPTPVTNSAYPACGDGGAAISALISFPILVSADSAGNIFFVDQYDNKIREIASYTAFPSTPVGAAFASQPSQNILLEVTGGALTINSISSPTGPNGEPEFKVNGTTGCTVGGSNASGTICKVNVSFNPAYVGPRTGQVVAVTSNGTFNFGVSGVGLAPLAVLSPGTISTVAGIGVVCSSPTATCGDGGSATAANFNQPLSGAFDSAGNFYIADSGTGRIREVNTSGVISTVAGGGSTNYVSSPGGLATAASLVVPTAVAFDATGNMYIADSGNHVVARVDAVTKDITVYAGTGVVGHTGDGGPATSARLYSPSALFLDTTTGNLYIADNGYHLVRMVSGASGIISTVAGNATACSSSTSACGDGGLATSAQLNSPAGVALDASGNLYIGDTFDNRVRRVNGVSGIITTVAGTGTASYTGDGSAATSATLYHPNQVATDAAGDLYIADYGNHAVRFVSASSGLISTIAGTGTGCVNSPTPSCGDGGSATSAGIDYPTGVALDPYGNLYVTEDFGYRVRKVTTNPATLAFTSEPIGSAAPTLNAYLYNIGNQTLTYTIPSSGSNALVTTTGPTSATSSAFGQSNSTTCGPIYSTSSATTLASGANCLYTLTFQPDTAAGSYTGTVVETDNSLNSGSGNSYSSYQTALTQTINLTGTATQATPSFALTSNLNPSLLGQSVTFTATVTGQGVAPTGTVTFVYVPAGSTTPVTLPGGPFNLSTTAGVTTATVTTSALPLGANSVSAQYNGDSNYQAPPASTVTQTVNQQSGTGDTLTAASSTINAGSSDQLTFAIPLVNSVSVPTGTVTFSSGGTTLTTATWPGSPVTGTCPPSGPGTCYLLSPTTAPTNIPIGSPTTVTATFAPGATSGYAAPGTAPTTAVTVNALADVITVTSPVSPDAVLYNSGTVPISASSTSGQPLTYTSSTPSVCSVTSPGGVVTTLSTGTCTISVTQPAAGNYAAASPHTVTLNVGAGANTITFPPLANTQYGATPPVPAATATSGVAPTYTSSTTSVCTVTSSGVITDLAVGACTITAAQSATGNFAAATSVSQSFNITQAPDAITVISPSSPYAVQYNSGTVPITASSTSGQPLTYNSATMSVCTVSSTGVVTTLATGTCTIDINQAAAGNYAAATQQVVTINVSAGANTITFPPLANAVFGATPPASAATATSGQAVTYSTSSPSTICTVTSGGTITDVGVGSCTITAAQSATGNFAAATSVSQSFNITQAPDAITVTSPSSPYAVQYNAGTVPISASSTSGQPLAYTSATMSVCTVSSTGVVTTLATGTCTIDINQAAAGNYAAATQQVVTINVSAGANTITFPALANAQIGATAPVPAATATSGQPVTYTSSTTGVCTVTSGGVITDVTPGTCTITAAQSATGNYAAATSVSQSFTVTPLADSITVTSPSSPDAVLFNSGTVPITAHSTSGQPLTYTSTTLSVCTVTSPGGVVTTLATGTCTISVTQPAAGNYGAATPQTVTINIGAGTNTITFPALANTAFGATAPVPAATATSGVAPTYASSTPSVCTVTSGGVITDLAVGTCTITAAQSATGNFAAATSVSQSYNVTLAADIITIPGTVPATAPVNGTVSIGATTTSGVTPTYTSTTPTVCTVSSTGVVTALTSGTCTVSVTQPAAGNYAAATPQTVTVTVGGLAQTIQNFGTPITATFGGAAPTLAATATSSLAPTYTATGPACSVTSSGTVTILAAGTCQITASQAGNGTYAAATPVSETLTVNPASDTITIPGTVPGSAPMGGTVSIGATTTSGVTPTYTSTTPTVCSVSATGIVTTLATGTCAVNVTQPAAGNYAAATPQTVTIAVAGQSQTIQNFGTPIAATFGATAPTLAATASSGLTPTYSATGSACSVTSSGAVTILAAGTCQITASQAGNSTYAAATPVSETLTVNPAADTITIPGTVPGSAPVGGAVSIAATTTSGVAPTYTSTTPTVCSVSATGIVTTLATGTCTVSVTQPAAGNYAAATPQTVTIAVAGQSQTIQNFGTPITATFGGAAPTLAATATSNLAPTYTATGTACSVTSSGTVTLLTAGTCQITASQAGNSTYAAATPVSETLTVNPAANAITVPPTVPASVTVNSGTISLDATATSGAPVTYASTTPTVCTVTSPGGVVTVLSTGSCTITASQAATGGYAAATTQTVTINILANATYDFTIAANTPLSQIVLPGGAVVYTYALAPVGGQYPGAVVTYSPTGLPPGSTYTLTPATGTVTATGGPQTLTLTVTTAQAVAMQRARQSAAWTLALLLPLIATRRKRRKLAQAMTMLVLLAVGVGALAVTGCANPHGFFGEPVANYTITVTATSGAITHSAAPVTLEVQ